MKVWTGLYAMTWLVFLELLIGMTPNLPTWLGYAHAALGIGILALAFVNFAAVRDSSAPGRVKRTVRSTRSMCVVMVGIGLLMTFGFGAPWGWGAFTFGALLALAHAVVGLTIFAQAAATGIAYDMWEEKEFAQETETGVVPPMTVEATRGHPVKPKAH